MKVYFKNGPFHDSVNKADTATLKLLSFSLSLSNFERTIRVMILS